MRFLLVNDDGFNSQGILLVEKILKKFGEVYVVAPKEHQSGKSCSILLRKTYDYIKVDEHHYMVDGLPTSCTIFGLNGLGIKFDCVVSGCNHGLNITIDSMYSGTIGACFESLFQRVPAIAISCEFNYDLVEKKLSDVLTHIFEHHLLSKEYLLNVNFPIGDKIKGIKFTTMHPAHVLYNVVKDEQTNTYSYTRSNVFSSAELDSDVYAVNNGYVSITPLRMNTFHESDLKKMK